VHWLDLGTVAAGREAEIEALFEDARPGDYLIADHFDRGQSSVRDQLIYDWAGVGRAKGLRMIVASRYYHFNELRRLCHQYHVRVKSVQQMPLSDDEVFAFLRFHLCCDPATSELSMPLPIRKEIVDARGNLRRVLEIVARDDSRIEILPVATYSGLFRDKRRVAALLAMFALAGGFGWQMLTASAQEISESTLTASSKTASAGDQEAPGRAPSNIDP